MQVCLDYCCECQMLGTAQWRCGRGTVSVRRRLAITGRSASAVDWLIAWRTATRRTSATPSTMTPTARPVTRSMLRQRAVVSHRSQSSSTYQPPTAVFCYQLSSLSFSYKLVNCCLSVCVLNVCLDVNRVGTNRNRCTRRLE